MCGIAWWCIVTFYSIPSSVKLRSYFFVWLVGWLISWRSRQLLGYIADGPPKTERLIILRAATHETELGDHDFCLSRSDYTDTDRISRERAATAGIEPGTSSPGVVRPPKIIHQCPMSQHIFLECTFLCRAVVGR